MRPRIVFERCFASLLLAAGLCVATAAARLFSERLAGFVDSTLTRFSRGLGVLRSGRRLLLVSLQTLAIWLVVTPIPLLAAFAAVGVDFGSALASLRAAWITQAAIGMAVALPSAPGFFGPYHFACKVALERFGIPPETAVALGTLIHAVFWLSLTGLGLLVLRTRHTPFGEIEEVALPSDEARER